MRAEPGREPEREPRPDPGEPLQPGTGIGAGDLERAAVGRESEPHERPLDGAPAELERQQWASPRKIIAYMEERVGP